jgi:hypothetical protein
VNTLPAIEAIELPVCDLVAETLQVLGWGLAPAHRPKIRTPPMAGPDRIDLTAASTSLYAANGHTPA